jgi:hypothetical protein
MSFEESLEALLDGEGSDAAVAFALAVSDGGVETQDRVGQGDGVVILLGQAVIAVVQAMS